MNINRFFLLTLLLIALSTCTSEVYSPDVCFQENVLPIFVSKCSTTGCHNAVDQAEGYDFSNYEGIMKGVKPKHPYQSEVYNVIRGNNPSMPEGQKLDPKDISYIKIWIKMGAENSSNCTSCDTASYSYSNRVRPMINNWCVGCHNSGSAGGGYDLSDYTGVVAAVTDNRLLGSLKHLAGFSAMPKNTNKLNDCDLSAVVKWINMGYPNN